jgi:hypothetical protein
MKHFDEECNILHSPRETLVTLWVVVLETNLKFDGFDEITLFIAIGFGEKFLDGASHA